MCPVLFACTSFAPTVLLPTAYKLHVPSKVTLVLQWFCSYPQHDFLCTAAIISVSQHLQYPINDLLGPDLSLEISQSCIVHTLQLVFMSACHGSSSATLAGNHIDNLTSPLSACPSTFHLVISATLPPWFTLFGSVCLSFHAPYLVSFSVVKWRCYVHHGIMVWCFFFANCHRQFVKGGLLWRCCRLQWCVI